MSTVSPLQPSPSNAAQADAVSRRLAIVPAYNEQDSVGAVVASIQEKAPDFDVLVIDDGSTDDTAGAAAAAGATVIQHPFNLGIGGAVQSGFKHAQRNGYEFAVQVDADGQHDPAYLANLLEALQQPDEPADIACGTRFLEEAGYKVPVSRRTGIRFFSVLLSLIVRQKITDPTSGFRMTNRRGIELFARDYPHDYPEVEAILMMHAHRLRLCEVPVRMNERNAGQSSIATAGSAYYMLKVLLAVIVGMFRARPSVDAGSEAPVRAQRGI